MIEAFVFSVFIVIARVRGHKKKNLNVQVELCII